MYQIKTFNKISPLGLDELVAAQQEELSKNFAKMDGSYWN